MGHALVIGGGIGGLSAAIALRQVGWTVTVFEQSGELREVGAGLTLWTNAVKVLRKLGLQSRVENVAHPIHCSEMRSWNGEFLMKTDFSSLNEKLGTPTVGIHRADLQFLLADALGRENLRLGAECSGFRDDLDAVVAQFSHGMEERGDILIGADGIHSRIRKQLRGDEPLRYAGYTAWRGIGPIDHPELPIGMVLLAIGKGSQVGMLPIGRERIYWFATANMPAGRSDPPGGRRQSILKRFQKWYAPFLAAVEATSEAAIIRNDIYDRPPTKRWGEGRATLLGDAAHPTTPNLGQGACQAIESALVLARHLAQSQDPAAALRKYEESRFDRTAFITNRSWALGKLFAYESDWACRLRNMLLKMLGGFAARDTEMIIGVDV